MPAITHLGQYWSNEHGEVRLLGCLDVCLGADGKLAGVAFDLSGGDVLLCHRRLFRRSRTGCEWPAVSWTYSALPFPAVELVESLEARGMRVDDWARDAVATCRGRELDLSRLQDGVAPEQNHLVAPIIPRRAQAFGVTYLNSALEREAEGNRGDYAFVYKSVKERGERPELFIKGTAPEHFVGPGGKMGLRTDLTNSRTHSGTPCERQVVAAGIEPELAAAVYSTGEIWAYTLANDVSGNRIENESLLYLYQAKHFTGSMVLGPLLLISTEQDNPRLEIVTRIHAPGGALLFERRSRTANINSSLSSLISWAAGHVRLAPGEVFATGTDVVPDGAVKVLAEGMRVEISCPEIGCLWHGAAAVVKGEDLNLDYSRLEFEGASNGA